MVPLNVLVVTAADDIKATGIAKRVIARADMTLVGDRPLRPADADERLRDLALSPRCAVIVVGRPAQSEALLARWLTERADLVVMHVDFIDDTVRMSVRNPHLDSVLNALRGLVERVGLEPQARVAHLQVGAEVGPARIHVLPPPRPVLDAATAWVHALLRDAVDRIPAQNGDLPGVSLSKATVLDALDTPAERPRSERPRTVQQADDALNHTLAAADPAQEPLAAAAHTFALDPFELRMLLLALAPELDVRYQRAIGLLLDEVPRRTGTYALYASLLGGSSRVRAELSQHGALSEWLVFDAAPGRQPAADEPLRLDPFLAQWLLGDRYALAADPRARRTMRLTPWAGAGLLQRPQDLEQAERIVTGLAHSITNDWMVVNGDDPAGWRALFELGAMRLERSLIRVDTARLTGADMADVEECARRLGRLARLTGDPLVIDATRTDSADTDEDLLRAFFSALAATGSQTAVIGSNGARIVRLIGGATFELVADRPISGEAHGAAVRAAAIGAGAFIPSDIVDGIATRYPLQLDGLEQAAGLARSRRRGAGDTESAAVEFTEACREVAAAGISRLADRIEPLFRLEDVVLPADQHQQLDEIVANVRYASRVLDDWSFGAQLPYGRGVTALFFGPSGTGKTMAAIGIARTLGIQILRLDLSRVVSKYIGETEKNIDRVFTDAESSGSTILIDEAEALLGKRSEVKDAHDRYANIEVAYLLQRMEAFQGLAILTTNMRQNLDPAFLRRLRFIVDFPRPDADARERIWRQCLPECSHAIDDRGFRQLARKIDLTGGHIRQMTIRAAFLAAAADTRIGLAHIAQAARAEFAKLGMPPVDIDTQGKQAA